MRLRYHDGIFFKKREAKTSEDLIEHFQKRCMERIGIILSQRILKQLMQERKLIAIERQSRIKTKFRLPKENYNGKQMLQFDVLLVYNKKLHAFVTVWKYGSEKPS